jgi:hypothetical protein
MTPRVALLSEASVDERLLAIVLDDPELFELEFGLLGRDLEPPVVNTDTADHPARRGCPFHHPLITAAQPAGPALATDPGRVRSPPVR